MANKLTDHEITRRQTLKSVMEHDLFVDAMADVKRRIADEMLRTNDREARERLFNESLLINRVQSRMEEYVNELLFLEKGEAA